MPGTYSLCTNFMLKLQVNTQKICIIYIHKIVHILNGDVFYCSESTGTVLTGL